MKKKIAYIYIWEKPPIRESVQRMLIDAFPDFDIDPISIGKMLKHRPALMALNEVSVARYYGVDILRKAKKHSEFVIPTPFLFHHVHRMLLKRLKPHLSEYAFTFQMQSMFDTSQPGLPHFIYTDRTVLANLAYPGFDQDKLYAKEWIALEKKIYDQADLVFTRSPYINKSLIDDYQCPPEKPVCVYAGSNTRPVEAPAKDPDRYARKKILFVGVNWEVKGGPDLEKAFRKVLETHPDAILTIIGSSPEIDLPQVQVLGHVPLAELPLYYQHASLFCLPTKFEAFGVAFIEAMENRLPIVATNVGAIPDFVIDGENGYLVESGDSDALAGVLTALLNDPARLEAFGGKSWQICEERYNWKNTGKLIREHVLPFLPLNKSNQ